LQLIRTLRKVAADFEYPSVHHYMKSRPSVSKARILFILFMTMLVVAPGVSAYTNRPPLWKYRTRVSIVASPALSPDGSTLYVVSSEGRIHAIRTDLDLQEEEGAPFLQQSKWTLLLPTRV